MLKQQRDCSHMRQFRRISLGAQSCTFLAPLAATRKATIKQSVSQTVSIAVINLLVTKAFFACAPILSAGQPLYALTRLEISRYTNKKGILKYHPSSLQVCWPVDVLLSSILRCKHSQSLRTDILTNTPIYINCKVQDSLT